jgi:hypothetical protein
LTVLSNSSTLFSIPDNLFSSCSTLLANLSLLVWVCSFQIHFLLFFRISTSSLILLSYLAWYSFFFFYYSYVHTRLGSFLPPAPTPSLTTHSALSLFPHPLNTQQKLFFPYF